MNSDGKTCADCAKLEYHEGDMYHSCRRVGETFPNVRACAHYMGKITLPGPNEYEQDHKDDPRNRLEGKPMTSIVTWHRYDGTPETLPERCKPVLAFLTVERDVFPAYRWEYEDREFWQILASDSRSIIVGDLWAYLPEPPETSQ